MAYNRCMNPRGPSQNEIKPTPNLPNLKEVAATSATASTLSVDVIEGEAKSKAFSELLDRSFGLKGSSHYLDDFPVWDENFGPEQGRALRIGIFDSSHKEQLVSCAGIRLAEMRVPAGVVKVALIGAVATAESHRGQGLASRIVSLAIEWARERDAVLAVLWGSETAMYERLGFELCGMQVRAPLSALDLGPRPDFARIVLGRGWVPSLMGCLRMRGTGLRTAQADESWIEAHRNVQWYWLGEPEAPMAYAAIDRGIDLQGIVHEWGGDNPEALKVLLHLIRMERPEAQLLASPQILGAWGLDAPKVDIEFLCMARSLNTPKLLASHGIVLPENDPLLTTPNAAVCRLLFGPSESAMPLWIWGLDAV